MSALGIALGMVGVLLGVALVLRPVSARLGRMVNR